MQEANGLQQRIARLDRRTYGLLVGLMIGISAGLIGLLLAVGGPLIAAGAATWIGDHDVFGLTAFTYAASAVQVLWMAQLAPGD